MTNAQMSRNSGKAWHARTRELSRKWRLLIEQPTGILGLAIIIGLVVAAVLAPWLAPFDPYLQSLEGRLVAPSTTHLFGTDELGRDILSRLIYGSRITVYIVLLVALIAAPIGLAVGAAAGYLGGWIDNLLMRVTDIFLALPGLILALAVVAALGPGIGNAVVAIALTVWPPIARLARAEALTIRNADYINAMRVQGASNLRIIVRHIFPECIPSVIVRITLNMAGIVLAAAALGFLGLGAQPPIAEWGSMLAVGRQYMTGYWWITLVPGVAILLVSLAFNLLGDALRDVFDPRQN